MSRHLPKVFIDGRFSLYIISTLYWRMLLASYLAQKIVATLLTILGFNIWGLVRATISVHIFGFVELAMVRKFNRRSPWIVNLNLSLKYPIGVDCQSCSSTYVVPNDQRSPFSWD